MARQRNSSSGILGLVMTVVVVFVLFKVFSIALSALWFLGPLFLIIAFFLNRSVVTKFFKSIFTDFKTKPVMSVAKALLSFFALPMVGGYLFGKAILKNKVAEVTGQAGKQKEKEFTEYEEVKETSGTSQPKEDDFLDISEIEQQLKDLEVKETVKPKQAPPKARQAKQPKPDSNKYDNLFD